MGGRPSHLSLRPLLHPHREDHSRVADRLTVRKAGIGRATYGPVVTRPGGYDRAPKVAYAAALTRRFPGQARPSAALPN
jgi:hypothetical protein